MGQTREQRIIKQLTPQVQKRTPVATDMYLPNHSGIQSHPEIKNLKVDTIEVLEEIRADKIIFPKGLHDQIKVEGNVEGDGEIKFNLWTDDAFVSTLGKVDVDGFFIDDLRTNFIQLDGELDMNDGVLNMEDSDLNVDGGDINVYTGTVNVTGGSLNVDGIIHSDSQIQANDFYGASIYLDAGAYGITYTYYGTLYAPSISTGTIYADKSYITTSDPDIEVLAPITLQRASNLLAYVPEEKKGISLFTDGDKLFAIKGEDVFEVPLNLVGKLPSPNIPTPEKETKFYYDGYSGEVKSMNAPKQSSPFKVPDGKIINSKTGAFDDDLGRRPQDKPESI